ncbi:hypothetical protein BJ508DRAFT_419693 [Ascobolus immersus RN42]|uniref:F-box domain-containing protein n=1 Tax=Ascobolus immersus RN42 TaxID=1160509 RepID=A0A3N4HCD9_ASCIM|nr:hypothetical protein BJ508DRAFT_419693 [Ascobolus immersus RN42]
MTSARPSLLALPSELILEIFNLLYPSTSVEALAFTHPRLYTIYQTHQSLIYHSLRDTIYDRTSMNLIALGNATALLDKTRKFLTHCAKHGALAIGPLPAYIRLERRAGFNPFTPPVEAMPAADLYWIETDVETDGFGRRAYNRLRNQIRFYEWPLFRKLYSEPHQTIRANRWTGGSYRDPERQCRRVVLSVCAACDEVHEGCRWHRTAGDQIWMEELAAFDRDGGLEPLGAQRCWSALVTWLYWFAKQAVPLSNKYPAGWEKFKCRFGRRCRYCSDWWDQVPDGGYHVWDHSCEENMTEQESTAMMDLETRMKSRNLPPFSYPYTKTDLGPSFVGYWTELRKFTGVAEDAGRLKDLAIAKKRYFSAENAGRMYDRRELEYEAPAGTFVRKTIVVDRKEWHRVIGHRQSLLVMHRQIVVSLDESSSDEGSDYGPDAGSGQPGISVEELQEDLD